MMCLDGIGRESWDWVGQMSVGWLALNSPQELGEESLTVPKVKWLLLLKVIVTIYIYYC